MKQSRNRKREDLQDYLSFQAHRIKNYSFIDGDAERKKINLLEGMDIKHESLFKREFAIPSMKDLFKDQASERVRFENSLVKKKLLTSIKKIDEFGLKMSKEEKEKGRRRAKEDHQEDGREKWIRSVVHSIQSDRKQINEMLSLFDGEHFDFLDISKTVLPKVKARETQQMRRRLNSHLNNAEGLKKSIRQEIFRFREVSSSKKNELSSFVGSYNSNLQDILHDKRKAYSKKERFGVRDLEELRSEMNRKLTDKIELIKRQSQRFYKSVLDIKSKLLIIPDRLIELLERVRVFLTEGKILRKSDLLEMARGVEGEAHFDLVFGILELVSLG